MNSSLPRFLAAIFLFASVFVSQAQNIPYIHFGETKGFSNSTVYNIMQDSKGYYWLCTGEAVYRYDGNQYTKLTRADGLGDDINFNIFEDSRGGIWLAGYNSTVTYISNGKTYNSLKDEWMKPLHGAKHKQIYGEVDGVITFLDAPLGDQSLKSEKKFGVSVRLADEVKDFQVQAHTLPIATRYFEQKNDTLLIFSRTGVEISYDEKLIRAHSFTPGESIKYLRKSRDGRFIGLSMNNEVFDVAPDGTLTLVAEFPNLSKLKWANLWNGNQLFLYTPDLSFFVYDLDRGTLNQILKGIKVNTAIIDNQGTLVCASDGAGFFALPNINARMLPGSINGLGEITRGLHVGQDSIWIGSDDGKYSLYTGGKLVTTIIPSTKTNTIKTIEAHENEIYIGAEREIRILKPDGSHQSIIPASLKDFAVLPDKSILASEHATVTRYFVGDTSIRIHGSRSYCCEVISDSKALFASSEGLHAYDFITGEVEKLDVPLFDTSQVRLGEIKRYGDEALIGTDGFGLFLWGETDLTSIEALAGEYVSDIFIENNDKVWVGGLRGLYEMAREDKTLQLLNHYSVSDGMPSNYVQRVAVRNDTIHVTTPNGYASFPAVRNLVSFENSVEFGEVRVNGVKGVNLSDTVLRPSDQIEIPFSYSSLAFGSQISYEYKEKADNQFRPLLTNVLELVDVSGRQDSYEYTIRAVYQGEAIESSANTFSFTLRPFWYNRTWIQVLITAGLLTLIFYWIYTGIQRRRLARERELIYSHQLAQLEMQALKAQFNPHFVHNVLNAIQNFVIKNQAEEAYNYITRFSRLMRNYLVATDDNYIALGREFEMMGHYISLEQIRVPGKFDYEVEIGEGIGPKETMIPSMILQPFVENAINHGLVNSDKKGLLRLNAERRDKHIIITIIDNGIGRAAAKRIAKNKQIKQKSYGVGIVSDRLRLFGRLHDQKIKVEITDENPATGEGTRVTISIPETED